MSVDILLVLFILAIALVLLVTEIVAMDVVALMVLSALALTGLVTAEQAFSGFSNPAVITVWAMFILSEGLTRTGTARVIGTNVLFLAGKSEARMIAVIMLTAGVLSGFMNNIGVAALMLPVVMDVARRSGISPSRLLMPLAYGTLLGGLTTLVGTAPNLLISSSLVAAGLQPFRLFDFTPLGSLILLVGTLFVATIGRHLLPNRNRDDTDTLRNRQLHDQYSLRERMFMVRIPQIDILEGKALSELGLASSAGLLIIALLRDGSTKVIPAPTTLVRSGDTLLVQGRADRIEALRKWKGLQIERESQVLQTLLSEKLELRELTLSESSILLGQPVRVAEFRQQFGANILAVRRGSEVRLQRMTAMRLKTGDHLLVQCNPEYVSKLEEASSEFETVSRVSAGDLESVYDLRDRVFVIHVPHDSEVDGMTIDETRLGDAFDFRLLALLRDGELRTMPSGEDVIKDGDLLLVQGQLEDIEVLRGLQTLEVMYDVLPGLDPFESDSLQMLEVILDPHSSLYGKMVSELNFREHYQLELAAIWRKGKPIRSELSTVTLRQGDALLLLGPRQRLALLNSDENFIALSPIKYQAIDASRAPTASLLMLAVVGSVLLGWLPISIAAVSGATLMVLLRCLTMEEAYRSIEWRSIFLIAGMMPLGIAMEQTGAAEYIATQVMGVLGGYGPWAIIGGIYALTAVCTMIIPTAALVLLMAPIVLSASASMGTSPHTAMMAVAIAASASFTSPISHPANTMVMGPGGYRFIDYVKLGVPLTLIVAVVVFLLLGVFWPLQ